jgi:benzoate-CoA ligase family protein
MRASDLPLYYNAVDILERNLAARSDKVAVYSDHGNYTFGQMSEHANRIANALKAMDVRFGEVVAILAPDMPQWVMAFFGTLKIGAVHLGMNTLLKPHEYEYIFRDSRTQVLIVHDSLLASIEPIRESPHFPEHVVVIGKSTTNSDLLFDQWIAGQSAECETAETHREDICTLNYSSGTTGEPKGIPHAHKDLPLTAQLWGVDTLGLREEDRTFAVAKLFFTFGTGGNLIFPWYVGASITLYDGAPRFAQNILGVIQRHKPTILYNAPTSYAAILGSESLLNEHDISSLRLCVSAGESLPAPIWHAWKERTGLDIIDGIGSTENYHIFISNRPGDIQPGSSGRPVTGYGIRIVDENFQDVAHGEIGNLLLRSESASLSYLHQYERSRSTFMGEWLFTGDKYYVDEQGYFWHAGRSDDMLKVGGIWVSPVEVESTLISHPAVLECAVVGMKDPSDLVKPKAFVVLAEGYKGSDALTSELIEYCRQQMAEYKRPRWIEFVDTLPKTATGKIQRYVLRSRTSEPSETPESV